MDVNNQQNCDDTSFRWHNKQWLRINEIHAQSRIKYLEQRPEKAETGSLTTYGTVARMIAMVCTCPT
jgi:hypothetical protein